MLLVSLLLIVIGAIVFFRKRKSKYLKNIPGPKPNIFLGNLKDFKGSSDEFLSTLMRYTNTYGPIVRIQDGPFSEFILISDEKFMQHILSSPKLIDKSDNYDYFRKWLGTGLLLSTGLKWKQRRRLLTPAFHFSILANFVETFESVGDVFINKLEMEIGKSSLDVYPLVTLCTLDIICEAAMCTSINAQGDGESEYVTAVKTMAVIILDRVFSPLHPWLYPLTPNYIKEKNTLKILHAHTDGVIVQRKQQISEKTSANADEASGTKRKQALLDMLLQQAANGENLTSSDIKEEIDTFMFEGHDTTSSAISFTIYALATHPDIQQKAFDEQKSIFADIKHDKVTVADLQQMKYLDLVIKESLRLYPPVPMIGRKVAEDFEWNGTLFPKKLTLTLFPFATQRNPEYFPEPEKFIPERFEQDSGKNPYVYVPFSAGPRNCIGQKFAILELKSIVSKVLRNFEILPATPVHELKLAPESILVSTNGVRISLKTREENI